MTTALPLALAALAVLAVPRETAASPAQDYMLYCMGCHGPEARGVPGKVPALAGAVSRFMRTAQGRDYVLRVPGAANSALDDAQLAAVLNWLAARDAAAADAEPAPFTAAEVALVRRIPLTNVLATRHEVVAALAATGPAPSQEY
jgi:hypothetical protein